MNTDDPMAEDIAEEEKKTQVSEDGTEQYIKDPIYDIMSDKEIVERSEGLMGLLAEYQDKDPEE